MYSHYPDSDSVQKSFVEMLFALMKTSANRADTVSEKMHMHVKCNLPRDTNPFKTIPEFFSVPTPSILNVNAFTYCHSFISNFILTCSLSVVKLNVEIHFFLITHS